MQHVDIRKLGEIIDEEAGWLPAFMHSNATQKAGQKYYSCSRQRAFKSISN
jgi:hypothetical protein